MAKVVDNAHKKFTRTRKKATHDGIQEARQAKFQFDNTPLHPIFVERLESKQIAADETRFGLKRFKAKESFLEIIHGEKMFEIKRPVTIQSLWKKEQGEQNKEQQAQKENCENREQTEKEGIKREGLFLNNVIKSTTGKKKLQENKLSLAEKLLLKAQERKKREQQQQQQQKMDEECGTQDGVTVCHTLSTYCTESNNDGSGAMYRDNEFFMDTTRRSTVDDLHYSVKDATFDLNAESAQDAQQQRQVYAWSKRKNRFVRMNVNDAKALLRGVKNESGKTVNFKTKLEAYSRWVKKSNMRIQDVGEEEDLGPLTRARAAQAFGSSGNNNNSNNNDDDDDVVDISDPNQGKKLRIGRKLRRLPKDGHVRSFEEMALIKRRAKKESARLARKRQKRGSK